MLIPRAPRKPTGGTTPQMKQLQDALAQINLPTFNNGQAGQIGSVLRKKASLIGKQPTQYGVQVAQNQGALAESKRMEEFYKGNPIPQQTGRDFAPLPTREEVALPDRSNRANENAGRFASAITGLFAPNVNTQGTIREGQYKDEQAYQQSRENYVLALQKADQKYRDETFQREQALNFQAQEDTRNYQNALARYGQSEQGALMMGRREGLEQQTSSLSTLDEQVRSSAEGLAQLDADIAEIEARSKQDAMAFEAYGKISDLMMKAQELEQMGALREAEIANKEAMNLVYQEQVRGEQQKREQERALFPGRQREQGLRNQGLQSGLQTEQKQRALIDSQIQLNKAHQGAYSRQYSQEQGQAKAADFNAAVTNVKARLEPYKVEYLAAKKEFDDFEKERIKLYNTLAANGKVREDGTMDMASGRAIKPLNEEATRRHARMVELYNRYNAEAVNAESELNALYGQSPLSTNKGPGTKSPNRLRKEQPKGLTGKPIQIIGVR